MIELSGHRAEWAAAFRLEAARLSAALAGRVDAIEHIGSTAIPGLVAKPIIDLAARASDGTDPRTLGPLLVELGYDPKPAGPTTHAVYARSDGTKRTHLLHVFTAADWEHCNQRLFRDKLLHDASAVRRYQDLKLGLAAAHDDGRAYTAAKLPLIEELLNEERATRGLPPTTAWDK